MDPASDLFLELLTAQAPAPLVHRLRTEDPVHFVPSLGFWFVTRHDDVKLLFNDPENATQDRSVWEHFQPQPEGSMLRWFNDNSFARQGPEAHARFRRLFNGALTPRAVRRMDAQIREVVERFAGPLRNRPGEVLDLMGDFTNPIPNTVISRVTGVPPGADELRFRELAQGLIRGFFPFAPPEALVLAESSLREMATWVRQMAAERRGALGEDLISDLIRTQERDETLTDDEIVMLISVLIGAGSETTNLGGLVMIQTLLGHPEQLKRVRDDRSLIPKAVNEIMRFAFGGPAALQRFALRDFELRGQQIKKGQMLMLSFGGANRDPAVFDDPDTLDLERDARELLVFGNGPHYCLGANLARQEMGSMLDAALDIVTPGSQVREDLQQFQQMGLFKRPLNLPVEIAPLSLTPLIGLLVAYFEATSPDLAGSWSGVAVAAGVLRGTLTVENQGTGKAKGVPISLYLSSDAVLDPGDTRLPSKLKVRGLAPGAERAVAVSVEVASAVSGLYLIAVIDPAKSLDDLDRSDNTVAAQIP